MTPGDEKERPMDVSKVIAAINEAHKQLNTIIDGEYAAKRLDALRPLTSAANALTLAETHLTTAAKRTAPKEDAPAAKPKK